VVEGKRRTQGHKYQQRGNYQRPYRYPSAPSTSGYKDRDVVMTDRSSTPPNQEASLTPSPTQDQSPLHQPSPPHQPPSPTPPPPSQADPGYYHMLPMPIQVLLEDQILEQMDLEFAQVTGGSLQLQDTIGKSIYMSPALGGHQESPGETGLAGRPSISSSSPKSREMLGQPSGTSVEPATLTLELLGISAEPSRNRFYFNSGTTEEELSDPYVGSEQFQDAQALQFSLATSDWDGPAMVQHAIIPYKEALVGT
jgi:hypothetical protein